MEGRATGGGGGGGGGAALLVGGAARAAAGFAADAVGVLIAGFIGVATED